MLFRWFQRRRRRKLLRQPFPDGWPVYLNKNVQFYRNLTPPEQAKLRDDLRILVAEKHWEGCHGFHVTDEVKVTIAAQAALLVLGMKEQYFDNGNTILVYPTAYVARNQTVLPTGVVLEGDSAREGEAWYRGPVILSWDDVLRGGRQEHDGRNLVLHEFAHQLDMQNGRDTGGTPVLENYKQYEQWQHILQTEYQRLAHECEHGRRTLLDCYGTTNLAEFFAVSTECFFERGEQMRHRHPDLYSILSSYYRQDPARRGIAARHFPSRDIIS